MEQNQLYNILIGTCNLFKGVLDTRDYKRYILAFFFFKYICDNGSDKKESKPGEPCVRFYIPKDAHFNNLYKFADDPEFANEITNALNKVESCNESLRGIFSNVEFSGEIFKSERHTLQTLYNSFAELDLKSTDETREKIVSAFLMLLNFFSLNEGKKGGEMNTPPEIAKLLSELIQPKQHDSIYDGACGASTLILQVADSIVKGSPTDLSIYGQDINEEAIRISKMQILINGLDKNVQNFKQGNIFTSPQFTNENDLKKFDIVVSHPPFSLNRWNPVAPKYDPYNRFHRGIPPMSKGDYAFISHMIESAKEATGKIGIIASHGVLFRGASEYDIRKSLIEENLLEAVIGLPPNIFPGTSISGVILIFNKGKKDNSDVLFIDASNHYLTGRMLNRLKNEDIEAIVNIYKQYEQKGKIKSENLGEDWKGFARVVQYKEIVENDFNLNIPRYIDTFEEVEEIDIDLLKKEISDIEKELVSVQAKIKGILKELA
ncbi:MAG: SAM-dependent DNA methyltransferase [Bacteroidetes bacterium]|nr:MAG: SAM-dependent DNA methyltransferase [Bacteroidota bacterium]